MPLFNACDSMQNLGHTWIFMKWITWAKCDPYVPGDPTQYIIKFADTFLMIFCDSRVDREHKLVLPFHTTIYYLLPNPTHVHTELVVQLPTYSKTTKIIIEKKSVSSVTASPVPKMLSINEYII